MHYSLAFLLIFLITHSKCDETCRSKNDINCGNSDVDVNTLPPLVLQDRARVEILKHVLDDVDETTPPNVIKDKFFELLSMPLQTHCTLGKKLGGEWLSSCGFFDGDKYVCLDYLMKVRLSY